MASKAADTLKEFFRNGGAIIGDRGKLVNLAAIAAMAASAAVVVTPEAKAGEWVDVSAHARLVAGAEQRLEEAGIRGVFVLDRSRDPAIEGARLASVVNQDFNHVATLGSTTEIYMNQAGQTVCVAMGADPHASGNALAQTGGLEVGTDISYEAAQHWALYRSIGYCLAGAESLDARAEAFAAAVSVKDGFYGTLLPVMTVSAELRELTGTNDGRMVSHGLRDLMAEIYTPGFDMRNAIDADLARIAKSVRHAVDDAAHAGEIRHVENFGAAYRKAGLGGYGTVTWLQTVTEVPEVRQILDLKQWLYNGYGDASIPPQLVIDPAATEQAIGMYARGGDANMELVARGMGIDTARVDHDTSAPRGTFQLDADQGGATIGFEAEGVALSVQAGQGGVTINLGTLFGVDDENAQLDMSALFSR